MQGSSQQNSQQKGEVEMHRQIEGARPRVIVLGNQETGAQLSLAFSGGDGAEE